MKKLLPLALAAVLAILALAFSGRKDEIASGKPTVKIAMMLPLSGDAAVYGTTAQKVAKMFMEDWRAENPDAKYDYEILAEDTQMSPQMAATAMRRLALGSDKIDAALTYLSNLSLAINPIAEKEKVIQISWTVDPRTGDGDYNFRLVSDMEKGAGGIIEKIARDGGKKVAFVSVVGPAYEAMTDAILRQFKKQDKLEMAGAVNFVNIGEKDFRILLQKIKSAGADTVILEAMPPEADIFIAQAKQANLGLTITGYQTIGTVIDKNLVEGFWNYDDAKPNPDFVKRVMDYAGVNASNYSEYVYAMLQVLLAAFENAPAAPGEKPATIDVAREIPKVAKGLKSPFGTLGSNAEGNVVLPAPTLQQVVNGEIVTVEE